MSKKCKNCQSDTTSTGNQYGVLCELCKNRCRMCNCCLTKENQYQNIRCCKSCKKEYEKINSKLRREKSPILMQESVKKSKAKIKLQVFNAYSDDHIECKKCGYTDIRALSIDHIDGSGHAHKDHLGKRLKGESIYRWLKAHNFPQGFQVLCMNCQFIKRHENNENNENN